MMMVMITVIVMIMHLILTGSTWLMIMHKPLRRDTLSYDLDYKSQFPNRDVFKYFK